MKLLSLKMPCQAEWIIETDCIEIISKLKMKYGKYISERKECGCSDIKIVKNNEIKYTVTIKDVVINTARPIFHLNRFLFDNPSYDNIMIKRIRVMLEYHCYPVWLYDEDDDVIDTLLPEELRNTELDAKFDDLQARYDSLFVNNTKEFSYKGFSSPEEKDKFMSDWQTAYDELVEAVGNRYPITNEIYRAFPTE